MQQSNKHHEEGKEQIAQKTSSMQCEECGKEPKKVVCYQCYVNNNINHMWEREKLEKVKKIIDQILALDKIEKGKGNPYDENDYTHLF